jgi:hypothetical protein
MTSKRMQLLRESGIIGCLNGSGMTSENWRTEMTVDGKSFDGWPIHPDFSGPAKLVRTQKKMELKVEEWKGRELAIMIRQSLKDRGVEISDERYELIAEACEKEIDGQKS